MSAFSKKIILQRQLPDLGLHGLDVRVSQPGWRVAKNLRGFFLKLRFPIGDLIRMYVKALRQLRQCLLASDGSDRYLSLECRRVIPPCPFGHALDPFDLSELPGPALFLLFGHPIALPISLSVAYFTVVANCPGFAVSPPSMFVRKLNQSYQ